MEETFQEFVDRIKKNKGQKRNHRIKNSYGRIEYYKYYNANKPQKPIYNISLKEYSDLLKVINKHIIDEILECRDVTLPYHMGSIHLRKVMHGKYIINGKLVYHNPIDWKRTHQLWYENEEEYKKRTLVKVENDVIYNIYYNKLYAIYKNRCFYKIAFNREFKKRLRDLIEDNKIDAFYLPTKQIYSYKKKKRPWQKNTQTSE